MSNKTMDMSVKPGDDFNIADFYLDKISKGQGTSIRRGNQFGRIDVQDIQ